MRSVLFLMFAAFAAVACAESPKHAQQPGNGSGSGSGSDDVVCSEVSDTGSMFSHTECKPREQSQTERDDAQRWMKRPRSEPSATH